MLLALALPGCASPMPDRMTLGVQVDAESYQPKTYVMQFQWQIEHGRP